MANSTDVATGVITLGLCALGAYGISTTGTTAGVTDTLGPVAFPKAILCLLGLCGILQIWRGLKRKDSINYWPSKAVLKKTIGNMLLFLFYIALVINLADVFANLEADFFHQNMAFIISTFAYLICALYLNGRRKIIEMTLVAICVPVAVVGLFDQLFQIALP